MQAESPFYQDCLACLRSSPLFHGLNELLLRDMLCHCHRVSWRHRRILPMEEMQDYFHVLISGRVKISRSNPDNGRMVTLFLLGPGDVFCLFGLLEGETHESLLETLDDVILLRMPMDQARQWVNAHPEFNRNFLPYLGRQMSALAELTADLALHDTESRLARMIMRHVDGSGKEQVVPLLINDLSHESLAQMIGSVRVVVNRQLQRWKQEGIIHAQRGSLTVEHLHDLAARAEEHLETSDNR